MKKWKTVRVKQQLVEQVQKTVERNQYKNLSDFVSDAIQLRLKTITTQKTTEEPSLNKSKQIWTRNTTDNLKEIGVTEHFQNQLKEIVNIQTYGIGEKVFRNKTFGMVESWWFTFDLNSPINGKIVSINQEVFENPFILNVDPSLWIIKIKPE